MHLTKQQVKQALKTLGWSDVEAAHNLGDLSEDTIKNWKTGGSKCRGAAAVLLSNFVAEKEREGNNES